MGVAMNLMESIEMPIISPLNIPFNLQQILFPEKNTPPPRKKKHRCRTVGMLMVLAVSFRSSPEKGAIKGLFMGLNIFF